MQREGLASELVVPALLAELVAAGVWPADSKAAMRQNLHPLVARDRVRTFAPEEDEIHFQAPPFRTVAEEVALASPVVVREYWQVYGALDQIVPAKALIIGDFGLGSDAPIILDYGVGPQNPPVLRLRWAPEGRTAWVKGADSFAEFAAMLGLAGGVA